MHWKWACPSHKNNDVHLTNPRVQSHRSYQALGGLFSDMTLKTPTSTTPPKQHPSNGGHGDSNGNGNSGGRSGRVDLIAGLAASPVTVSGNPLLQFDPLTISAASSSSAASAAAAASATAAIAIPTPAPAPAPPTGARTDLLCDLLSASPPSISTSGGGLPLAPLPGMHAPVAHPQPQPPMPPVDLARMGQGMIPALQPRTIIPSVGDADGAGASAFSFIGGAGAGGGGAAPQRSMPGSMMMMMQGGVAPQGGGRGNGGGGKGGEDEAAFSFVKDAMKQSR